MAIVASGYSTKITNLELLRGKFKVIAIKENIDRCPWADAVYGCDGAWWRHRLHTLGNFKGMKMCWAGNGLGNEPGMMKFEIVKPKKGHLYSEELSFGSEKIGGGGNSGFQALNIAINWGAGIKHPIVLIGFDLHDRQGVHWYGRNRWPMANNPNNSNFRRWKDAFEKASQACLAKGIRIINASKGSDLKCFPQMSLEDAVGLCAVK